MMKHRSSLSDTLQNLIAKGYSLVTQAEPTPDESFYSDDWRLDSVEKIRQDQENILVIAVSSVSRCMKLIFVETLLPKGDFSPMTVLRRLFPMQPKMNLQLSPVA